MRAVDKTTACFSTGSLLPDLPHAMGCLPIILLFVLGTGLGWWLDGSTGAVWGAGIGIALGIVSGLILVAIVHRAHSDSNIDQ